MRKEDDEARNLTQLNGVNAIFQTGTALRHIPVRHSGHAQSVPRACSDRQSSG